MPTTYCPRCDTRHPYDQPMFYDRQSQKFYCENCWIRMTEASHCVVCRRHIVPSTEICTDCNEKTS